MKPKFLVLPVVALLPLLAVLTAPDNSPGQQSAAPAPTVVKIVAQPAVPASPLVTITLLDRHGHATPMRHGFSHNGGGNTDVAQPAPDTVIFTVTGVAVAGAHPAKASMAAFDFDLNQCFEVVFEKPEVKTAKMTLEGRVIGLLRSPKHGSGMAEEGSGCATVSSGDVALVQVDVPPHAVTGGQNLSINDHAGPVSATVRAGKFTLHQVFRIAASSPRCLLPCKAASAEFAPDPALDPLWISHYEPFHGAIKKDFGFQIVLKVAPDEVKEEDKNGDKKEEKKEDKNGKNDEKRGPEKLEKLPKLAP